MSNARPSVWQWLVSRNTPAMLPSRLSVIVLQFGVLLGELCIETVFAFPHRASYLSAIASLTSLSCSGCDGTLLEHRGVNFLVDSLLYLNPQVRIS